MRTKRYALRGLEFIQEVINISDFIIMFVDLHLSDTLKYTEAYIRYVILNHRSPYTRTVLLATLNNRLPQLFYFDCRHKIYHHLIVQFC